MNYILDLLQLDGTWMAPIKQTFVLLCLLCVIDLGSRGRFRLLNVSIALFMILLFCGFTGTFLEIVNTFASMAAPGMTSDQKLTAIHSGLSRGLDYSILVLGLAIPCLWLMALSRVIRKDRQTANSNISSH